VAAEPFWRTKPLEAMTREEWESLCDGCAQCCRLKLEDADTGEIAVTDVVCRLLDLDTCRCTDYPGRHRSVPDCIQFGAADVLRLRWLPESCAYRRVALGQELPAWHPLVCGDTAAVHRCGGSVREQVVSEADVPADALESRIVRWIETSEELR
jgi:uncharacterized cysteine cluster protein YcgN (CxxCxxCC family)